MTHADAISQPLVSLENVTVGFGNRVALSDITFNLPTQSITVIVGLNGAGKTTMLRLFACALKPSLGHITWAATASRFRAAFVAQAIALYPLLTLRENCLAAGRMEGLRGAALAAKVEIAMERTLCTDMKNERAGHLSGGYQRRAAIAAALMGDAPLVILDEPTTGLDVASTEAIVAVMRGLKEGGTTLVFTTHDFMLADATADQALFLREGRLTAVGAPKFICKRLFPAQKHVEVSLVGQGTPSHATLLAKLGATRLSGDRCSLFSSVDAHGCPSVIQDMNEAGVEFRDMHIREPGVAALFQRFCLADAS